MSNRADCSQNMTLRGGLYVSPNKLTPDQIHIEDIAEGLSKCCRFAGQCEGFYSVAEHSVYVAMQMPNNDLSKIALLHDAPEAYLGDLVRCVKRLCKPQYSDLEEYVWHQIVRKFELDGSRMIECSLPPEVHEADMRMLVTERRQIIHEKSVVWDMEQTHQPYNLAIARYEWRDARKLFMDYFHTLFEGCVIANDPKA